MDANHFQRSFHAIHQRRPFRPFEVELVSGDRFQVDHPQALVVRDGVAVFVAQGGFPTLFDHESVSQLIADTNTPQSR